MSGYKSLLGKMQVCCLALLPTLFQGFPGPELGPLTLNERMGECYQMTQSTGYNASTLPALH